FESERQALALMNHSNIAKVYDAGATEQGRPYFAMEYVKGIPINEYCDTHKLSTPERLELFIQVCEGIQHAHQKGIIHRDIKVSNVLVTIQDDKPVPKIIDFGVAKATAQRLTERTVFTEIGQLIGTPEYMSPEQAEMTGLDIDTRSDVYSLGVLLYELLVGVLPFESDELRSGGFDEIRRKVREDEPPKPSTRLTTPGFDTKNATRNRRTDLPSLTRQLKGELDWITMKAMAKDRTQRYASVSELAADIMRYLRHEPVVAGPPSAMYRMKKYVRRHRTAVAAAALVVVAMVIGITGTSIGLVKSTKAEKRTREEAQTAQQVSDFLVELFRISDPSEAKGNAITAREILDRGAERIEAELSEQPLIQARLMDTMGIVYRNLGLYDAASSLLEQALNKRRQTLG
ncbi:MAG: serine/threonine protein kinase, partial [Candidatus Aminicenantes bacterium]|nr:serine/threonine protein kinase [Candidatus Aminicenantes bacterium]